MSTARERFHKILAGPGFVEAAPVFDPLSARIASMQGWEVCKLSGSVGKFANLAMPDDVPMANISDLVDLVWRINRVCESCLIVDADDGGGSALNVRRTVRELEAAGATAIEIEDNIVPRRFGGTNRHGVMVSKNEHVGKLHAAIDARRDAQTVIVARSSALNEMPRDDAMERLHAYSATGAAAIMLPGLAHGKADIEAAMEATHLPLLLLGVPLDVLADKEFLEKARLRVRFLGNSPYAMAVKALDDCYRHLKAGGKVADLADREAPKPLLREVDQTATMLQWQEKYMRD